MTVNNDINYPLIEHRFTENDTGPPIECQYVDETGTPIDITGYTITFHLDRPTSVLVKSAVITNAANGEFVIGDPWAASDFVPGYSQRAEIQMVNGAGVRVTSQKLLIDVEEEIA